MGEDQQMEHISHIGTDFGRDARPALRINEAGRTQQASAAETPQQASPQVAPQEAPEAVQEVDQAEISELGRLLEQAHDRPEIRADKVAEVRQAIEQDADGFIRDRLDQTVDRLIDDLL